MVASSTNSEPRENLKLSAPSKESSTLDKLINAIAPQSLLLTASLKISRAIIAVATISKFPNNEALAEVP